MENWQLALVVISAILAGALIPAIGQYRSTMRAWERVIRENEGEVRQAVREISALSSRLNRMGSSIEANAGQVQSFFSAFEGITSTVKKLSGSVRTASVVGAAMAPAVTAAIRALQNAQTQRGGMDGEAPAYVATEEGVVPLVRPAKDASEQEVH